MSDAEIRIAVAEACGWKQYHEKGGTDRGIADWVGYDPDGKFCLFEDLPDYLNDLNAMRVSILAQPIEIQKAMRAEVWRLSDQMTVLPPARVYAEALLCVLGK